MLRPCAPPPPVELPPRNLLQPRPGAVHDADSVLEDDFQVPRVHRLAPERAQNDPGERGGERGGYHQLAPGEQSAGATLWVAVQEIVHLQREVEGHFNLGGPLFALVFF